MEPFLSLQLPKLAKSLKAKNKMDILSGCKKRGLDAVSLIVKF
jgi:hypothetical protein